MARPKKKPATSVGRPKSENPKLSLASLKGNAEYAEWLRGLVEHSHLPTTILLEHALREYAEKHGYAPRQPRR
jgi:hypothetical protein